MTTSTRLFEIHFTNPDDFVAELVWDAARENILDGIVRMAIRNAEATRNLINGQEIAGMDRPLTHWKARYVEASYISTRQQLVKLSCYAGSVHDGKGILERPPAGWDPNAETTKEEQAIARKVLAALDKRHDIEVRGGSLYVEQGAWVATPGRDINALPAFHCATCSVEIYFANSAWRHVDTRREEAVIDRPCGICAGLGTVTTAGQERRCTACMGQGVIKGGSLDHLADPEQAGKLA